MKTAGRDGQGSENHALRPKATHCLLGQQSFIRHSHAHSLRSVSGCFSVTKAELSSYNRDCIAHKDPGIKPRSPTLEADSLPSEPPGKAQNIYYLAL